MRTRRIMAVAVLIAGIGADTHVSRAQQQGITRTDVQRHDLDVPGREVIQVRVDFAAGTAFGKHSHPGAEIAYVLEGTLEYQLEGQPPVTLQAGTALFIPAGTIHAAKNAGTGNAAELATYIVEEGKPLVVMARSAGPAAAEDSDNAIRPFRVNVPAADLADLKRRLAATRWPDKETVADQSQGVPLARLQKLVRYWGTDYDWRRAEARLGRHAHRRAVPTGRDRRCPRASRRAASAGTRRIAAGR